MNRVACLEERGRHVLLSRRDILKIARRFNAGKHPARHTSPEGTAEGWGGGLDLGRPFGTRGLLASNSALKRWAIFACPFWTAKQRPSRANNAGPVSENLNSTSARPSCSADFQSAVLPTWSRQTVGLTGHTGACRRGRITNLRYSRVQLCATEAALDRYASRKGTSFIMFSRRFLAMLSSCPVWSARRRFSPPGTRRL